MKRVAILLLLLAGCGRQGELLRRDGQAALPVPLGATVSPTPTQMLELPTEARPTRVDDPLKKSEERRDDRFNLPPPG